MDKLLREHWQSLKKLAKCKAVKWKDFLHFTLLQKFQPETASRLWSASNSLIWFSEIWHCSTGPCGMLPFQFAIRSESYLRFATHGPPPTHTLGQHPGLTHQKTMELTAGLFALSSMEVFAVGLLRELVVAGHGLGIFSAWFGAGFPCFVVGSKLFTFWSIDLF